MCATGDKLSGRCGVRLPVTTPLTRSSAVSVPTTLITRAAPTRAMPAPPAPLPDTVMTSFMMSGRYTHHVTQAPPPHPQDTRLYPYGPPTPAFLNHLIVAA